MPDTQEDAVLKLIEKVDNNFEKRLRKIYFSRKTKFDYYLPFIVSIYYLILFMFAAYMLALVAGALPALSDQAPSTQIIITVSIIAAFIALASFSTNIHNVAKPKNLDEILFEYNYRVLKDDTAVKNPALFKGLVMLKSKHPDLSLKDIIDLPITKDKLLEILYK